MIADSSFLFALYFRTLGSPEVYTYARSPQFPGVLGAFQIFEFRAAVGLEVWRRRNGDRRGLDPLAAQNGLAAFEIDIERGVWQLATPDWSLVCAEAQRLTDRHAASRGLRAMDAFHIATAKVMGTSGVLTLDPLLREVALAEGLQVLP